MVHANKIKNTSSDKVFITAVYVIGSIFLLACAYPLIYVISASFSDPNEIISGSMWLFPRGIQLDAFKGVLKESRIWTGYLNTIIYSVTGTAINIALTTMAAYPLSRKELYGRSVITFLITFTMFFSGGLIPNFLLVKSLGMYNTMWALIIPGSISVYNFLIMRNYFQTSIPEEMIEAAYMDGCTNIGALFKIVLPLSKSILAVMFLFYLVAHWNDYFNALIYIRDSAKYPLQIFIREILIKNSYGFLSTGGDQVQEASMLFTSMQYAVILVASIPVLVIYPFMQRYLVKGVMLGSIKG